MVEQEPLRNVRQEIANSFAKVINTAQSQPLEKVLPSMSKERVESIFKEGSRFQERHLITSDYQIPDHNQKAVNLVLDFIDDFKPSHFHINGDYLNFTPFSRYDVIQGKDAPPIKEEIHQGRRLLRQIVERVRKNNPEGQIIWYEGNHEERLFKFIVRQAMGKTSPLLDLDINDEQVLSVPHLFGLKQLGVEWVPAKATKKYHNFYIEHGDIARKYAGYTGQAMMDRKGDSGTSGHTHRLALVGRTNAEKTMWWLESGSLCNSRPTPQYAKDADWQKGFGVMIYDTRKKTVYPTPIPIIKDSFMWGNKLYK